MLALRLVAAFAVVVALAWPAAAERAALIIGNGEYSGIPELPNPANDAIALGATLSGIGFDVSMVIDGDQTTMRMALEDFATRAADADVALVFYAGHGIQVAGNNYMLPVDIELRRQDDLQSGGVAVHEIFEAFAEAGADTSILILDACRENPFAEALGTSQGLASGAVSSAAGRPSAAGTVIAFSAAPGAVASDGVDGNSPYTTALLQWVARPGLELGTMLRRVRGTVLQLTNGTQVPWVEEALVDDVFLNPAPMAIGPMDDERVEVALLDTITDLAEPTEQEAAQFFYDRYVVSASLDQDGDAMDDDERLVRAGLIWLSIRESMDVAIFESFIAEFPELEFAELAQSRIDRLLAEPPIPPEVAWLDNLPPVPPPPGSVQEEAVTPDVPAQPPQGIVDTAPGSPALPQAPEAPGLPGVALPGTAEGTAPATDGTPPPAVSPAPGVGEAPGIAQPAQLSPSEVEAALGLTTPERAAVQMLLAEAGYYRGALDADFGPGTRGGIRTLQAAAGLPDTGFLTMETLRQLVARTAPALLDSERNADRHDDVHHVAAIAARGPGAEPEVIRVEAISRTDTVHGYWREIADEFEADNPGTLIEIGHRPGIRYRTELMGILGSETPPDILYTWSGGHLDALREAGFARDLTDEMTDGWAFEFKPGALQTYTHEGRIFGVPMHLSLISLYVNRSVFERAGVSTDNLDTWEGFVATVEALQAAGEIPLGVGGGDTWPYNLYFSQIAQRLGSRTVLRQALAGEGEGFGAPAFRGAGWEFERLVSLDPFQPGALEMDDGLAVQMLAEGRLAMVVTGNWRLNRMMWNWVGGAARMEEELLQLPFPSVGALPQDNMTYGGADGFAVAEDAPDIAIDFLRRLTAIDVQERMAEIAVDIPSLSGADLAIQSPFLEAAADRVLTSTYHQLFLDQALGPEVGILLNDSLVDVVTGELTSLEAVALVDEAWTEALGRQ